MARTLSPPRRLSAASPARLPAAPSVTVNVITSLTATVTASCAATATVGQPFTYTFTGLTTNAPTGDTVTYSLASGAPANMTYSSSTQSVSGWTPTAAQEGTTQSFSLSATDSLGNTATLMVFVAVSPASGITVVAPPADVAAGSPVLIALQDAASGTPTYKVTASSTADPNGTDITATVMPTSNPVLQIVTNFGEMDFQLLQNYTPNTVSHIESLIDANSYSTASFYRVLENFMIQGGVNGSTGSTIPVELNPLLRFDSSGLLAMANNGEDGNSSEFFVTGPDDVDNTSNTATGANTDYADGFLDFRYTIFGKLISGDAVRAAIATTPVTANSSSGEDSQPVSAVTITSMKITTEPSAGVVMLNATSAASGPYTVTVNDGLGNTQTFTINVGTNPYDPPNPWVKPVSVGVNSSGVNPGDQIYTAANTAVTFTPQGESADNTAVQTGAQLMRPGPTPTMAALTPTTSTIPITQPARSPA